MKYGWLIWLLPGIVAQAAVSEKSLLLYADFNGTADAVYSRGNGTAFVPEGVRRVGFQGALRLPRHQYIAYPAAGNLALAEGTILIEATIGFTPGQGTLPNGWQDAYLFAARNRTGQRLSALVNDKSGFLFFYVSNHNGQTSSVKIDVKNWKKGERRIVRCAWKRPGTISLAVSGLGAKTITNADLPDCPSAALPDIYIGSNAQGLPIQQYGRIGSWVGEIDELQIYGAYDDRMTANMPKITRRNAVPRWPSGTAAPEWVGANRRRIHFHLGKTVKTWKNNPVRVKLDLSKELGSLELKQRRAVVDAMRLVAADPATGKAGKCQPFQLDDDFLTRMSGELAFVHTGALPAVYSLYFDERAPYAAPEPAGYPFPGFGMPMMVGVKNQPGNFGGGLRGSFAAADFDGDGDVDLLFLSGTQSDSGRDLFNGLYYYENLRNRSGYDLFAAPVLVERGNNAFGHFRQTAPPRLADLDGDGKMECVFASGFMACYAEIRMESGVPALGEWQALQFDGAPPKLISSAALFDFNGDGLIDLFSDGLCHYNVGTRTQPLFRSQGESLFASGVAGTAEKSGHRDVHEQNVLRNARGENIRPLVWEVADVDGDGKADLVCGGWKSQIYYFPRRADGLFGAARELRTADGHELEFPGVFPFPLFADMNGDGALDLLLSSEDGTLGCAYNTARRGEPMKPAAPVSLSEQRAHLNAGALAIPVAADWDGDGRIDILAGAANGRVYFWKNIGTTDLPVYRNPVEMTAGGRALVWRAGPDGSIQGDQENDWGYLNIEVADWDGDGLADLLVSGVRGEHLFFRNIGTKNDPQLAAGELITVDFPSETPVPPGFRFLPRGKELLTAHRCRPSVVDWNGDGLPDYITTDHRDRLAFYERFRRADGTLGLKPGKPIDRFRAPFFRTMIWNHETIGGGNPKPAGMGRSATQIVDWDGDGKLDLLMDSVNARFFRNENGVWADRGELAGERLANHNTGPYAADLDGDGKLDLIVGTESGFIYGFLRSYLEKDTPPVTPGAKEVKP